MRPFAAALLALAISCCGFGQIYTINTFAGNGTQGYSGDNGPATSAQLDFPYGVAVDAAGNLYIADTDNSVIRKVSNGVITTVAAQLYEPWGVAVDSAGNVYIAETGSNRIRKVSNGVITTVAGNGTLGYSGDNGPATSAKLNDPTGVAVDSAGNLYIADKDNSRIREVSNGVITTVAGNGTYGFSGDNGPATSAKLSNPYGVAVDTSGNLYIADVSNDCIRKVTNGVITTVAGDRTYGSSGDNGPATSAELSGPLGVAVDAAGNLYIADTGNNRVRKITKGVITTVAGDGLSGFGGDNGPATSAYLNSPEGVAVDSAGNLYIADTGNSRIRVLTPSGASCTASVTPPALSPAASGGSFSVTIQTGSSCAWMVQSLPAWITVSGSGVGTGSGSVTLSVAANTGATRTATVSIAGVSVTVTQQGLVAPLAITTSSTLLSGFTTGAYFQDLAATGGSGAYTWTLTSGYLPAGLAISGASITGTPTAAGTFSFTLRVADTASDTASQAFSLTVVSVSASGALSRVGVLSQFAAGGSWDTTIWVVNTSASAVPVRLIFHGDDGTTVLKDANGNVTPTPLTASQQGDTQAGITATTLDRVLNPNTGLVVGCGLGQSDSVEGWIDVLAAAAGVSGFAVFRYATTGLTPSGANFVTPWEATVPLQTQLAPATMVLPFDNTSGFNNGVAIGTLSASAATITATFYDINGNALGTPQTIKLAANGHTAFMLYSQYPFTVNTQGSVVFTGTTMMGLGLRASPYGTLTSVPTVLQ